MSKTINYSAWPLKLWNVVCLLLLRIKYSLVGSCRYMASWQSVHVLHNWSRCTFDLIGSQLYKRDKWTLSI